MIPHLDKPLRNFWYLALPSRKLKKGRMKPMTLLGDPIVLGRKNDGGIFALRDICPHRGMPLHHGSFDGCDITCCYHGWQFGGDGQCNRVPSLLAPQDAYGDRIKVRTYPAREVQGNIWVFVGDRNPTGEMISEVPIMEGMGDVPAQVHCSLRYPLGADDATYTLMDPSHVAYVHSSVFVKRGAEALRDKKKDFVPGRLGWQMSRHPVPKENHIYRLFGNNTTTEITYELPGRRIESIRGDKHRAVSILTVTPLTEHETEVHQALYWTMDWLKPFTGIFKFFIHRFLDQDRHYALLQRDGLRFNPVSMLLGDGDAQIQWFLRLKQEWLLAEMENRPFVNPLKPQTLKFRS